jgi:SAM-dependent methyltransferase
MVRDCGPEKEAEMTETGDGGRIAAALVRLKHAARPRTRVQRWAFRAREEWMGVRPAVELARDLRWGGWCGGSVPNPFADRGAVQVQSTHYDTLARLFRDPRLSVHPRDVLVDVGCGKGRVLNFWLGTHPRNRVVGLELVEPVAERTARRLRRHATARLVGGDAVQHLPADGTLFYLYNPFGADTVAAFAARLLQRNADPARVRIVYLNPRHLSVFEDDPRWRVEILETGLMEKAAFITVAAGGADASRIRTAWAGEPIADGRAGQPVE